MARGKKKEDLTLEKKLERALVPVEEQPYEVPGNWCWTYLTHGFCECMDSFRKPINASERAKREGEVPYYGATGQVGWIDDYLTDEQLVLVGEDGAPFFDAVKDKAYMIDGKAWVNNHAHILKSYYGEIGNKFIMNYLNSFNYKGYVNGTTRLKLTQASMNTIPVPLPPLSEQQRIVERIESMFAKLDEAKEKVLDVLQLSEIRQSSLINHVFTGELIGITDLQTIPLFDIVEEIKIGPFGSSLHKEDYIIDGIPVINPKHINKQKINPNKEVSITSEKAKELATYILRENDIIMGRRGEMGRTAPVSQQEEGYICGTGSLIIRLKKGFRADLYSQVLGSQSVINYLEQNCVGSTMKNLNEKIVKQIPVPYFTEEQQDKLMFRFESMLADEKQIFNKLRGIIDAIDMMKKSILAKAFRGELGTNNMKEEFAIDLLKAVFNEKYVK